MVRLRVREIAEQLGIENARQLARCTGLQPTTCYKLWSGHVEMLGLNTTLNVLCNRLQVSPGLLFEFIPDRGATGLLPLGTLRVKRGRPRTKSR
ncbi:MAG: helix-turn-helix domain-containing protein [Blastocatellia bacterium]